MKIAYTYTILRYVYDIATGEFVNVGVALYAPAAKFAAANCRTTYARISKVFPGMNGESFRSLMRHIQIRIEMVGESIRNELPLEGAPADVMEIAHGVLPHDDSSLQWSAPGSGLSDDPAKTLDEIFNRMVLRYDEAVQQPRRSDDDVWKKFKRTLEARNVTRFLSPKRIVATTEEVEFQHAWKNNLWHCLEPISFDLADADNIRDKANRLLGQLLGVADATEPFKVYLLVGRPQQEKLTPAYEKAVANLIRHMPVKHEIVMEEDAQSFSSRFSDQVNQHISEIQSG